MKYDNYFGLGDSISIDYYTNIEGGGAISLFHKNLDIVHPEFYDRDLSTYYPEIALHNLAVDGETTSSICGELIQIMKKSTTGHSLVTMTIGGNDLLQFMHKLGVYNITSSHRADELLLEISKEIEKIVGAIKSILKDDVDIIIGSIYDPTDETGLLYGEYIPIIIYAVKRMNQNIKDITDKHNIWFADIHKHFLGHGNKSKDCWYIGEIEPNVKGASEVRRVFIDTLDNHRSS